MTTDACVYGKAMTIGAGSAPLQYGRYKAP